MPPLISMRYPADAIIDDLLWPGVTKESQIRMESGEVVSWRGMAQVAAEVRSETDGKLERVWKMTGPVEYTVTNHRIFYQGKDIERGSGRLAKIAWCLHIPESDSWPAVAAGQVRFQWPASVSVAPRSDGRVGITLLCFDGKTPVQFVMVFDEDASNLTPVSVAANVARILVTNIAGFRLKARAGQLKPEYAQRLTLQRDNPTHVKRGTELTWRLDGALRIGQPSRLSPGSPADPRIDRLSEDVESAMNRYKRRGRIEDLETSLRLARSLLDDSPPDSPNRLAYINLYAGALHLRYENSGDLDDLKAAIDIMREVAKQAELEEKQWLPGALGNLGSILIERWQRALDERDLAQGIAVLEAALAAAPRGSDEWALCASNLGFALNARYPLTCDLSDVDRAIELYRDILDSIPRRSSSKGDYLANLGGALLFRYRINESQDDLSLAINAFQEALQLIPRKAPARYVAQMALADATNLQAGSTGFADVHAAVNAWRKVCFEGQDGSPARLLQAALRWSSAMIQRGNWAVAVEACNYGLAAADRLFRLQLTREHKGLWLEEARELPARAAYALAKLGQLQQAAVTLERGRAVFVTEALARNHADLDRLAELGFGGLRERYQQVADELACLERAAQAGASAEGKKELLGAHAEAVRQARAELEHVVATIREIKGYEDFLAYPTYHEIALAAVNSPLVYIGVTEAGGFALVIDGRSSDAAPTVIWLDELTKSSLTNALEEYLAGYAGQLRKEYRQRWDKALDAVTRRLWNIVIGPVLNAVPTDRFTLLPGDLLGILPLHAAWTEDASTSIGRRYALDDALITYAPSARALKFAQQDAPQKMPDKVLVVYDPSLPASEFEMLALSRWFSDVRQLRRDQTTLEMVQAALPEYPVLHFSCHGLANIENPLDSCLAVACDGNLTLRDLLEQRLSGTRLAVLSACETALVGRDVPEEVVSLPSGLLQAGAIGVLGTLWPVADAATAALMARFYQLWRGTSLDPAEALRQAQRWFRDNRTSSAGIHASELINAGEDTHVHPTHWAAFTFMGQ